MTVESLASLTFEALGIAFLYDLDAPFMNCDMFFYTEVRTNLNL